MSRITKEGYLMKAPTTDSTNSNMKKRYFRLIGNSLEYFETKNDARPKGSMPIHAGSRIVSSREDELQFTLFSETRILRTEASSKADRDDWIRVIQAVIDSSSSSSSGSSRPPLHESSPTKSSTTPLMEVDIPPPPPPPDSTYSSFNNNNNKKDDDELRIRKSKSQSPSSARKSLGNALGRIRKSISMSKGSKSPNRPVSDGTTIRRKANQKAEDTYIRKCGYLFKQGGFHGGLRNYKKRYFVLRKDLLYFKTEEDWLKFEFMENYETDEECPWHVKLNLDMFTCQKNETQKSEKYFEFFVNCVNKELVLRTLTASDRTEWMNALNAPLKKDIEKNFVDCLYDKDKEKNRLVRLMESQSDRLAEIQVASHRDTLASSFSSAGASPRSSELGSMPSGSRRNISAFSIGSNS